MKRVLSGAIYSSDPTLLLFTSARFLFASVSRPTMKFILWMSLMNMLVTWDMGWYLLTGSVQLSLIEL